MINIFLKQSNKIPKWDMYIIYVLNWESKIFDRFVPKFSSEIAVTVSHVWNQLYLIFWNFSFTGLKLERIEEIDWNGSIYKKKQLILGVSTIKMQLIRDPLLKWTKMYHRRTRQFAPYNTCDSFIYNWNRYIKVTHYHTTQRLMLKLNDVISSLFGCFW